MNSENPPWETIFNGHDFEGWSMVRNFGEAWVEDGVIVTHMVSNTKEHTFLKINKIQGFYIRIRL